MKTKFTILLIVVAVLTLSFTFSMKRTNEQSSVPTEEKSTKDAPVGGLGSEDKL